MRHSDYRSEFCNNQQLLACQHESRSHYWLTQDYRSSFDGALWFVRVNFHQQQSNYEVVTLKPLRSLLKNEQSESVLALIYSSEHECMRLHRKMPCSMTTNYLLWLFYWNNSQWWVDILVLIKPTTSSRHQWYHALFPKDVTNIFHR